MNVLLVGASGMVGQGVLRECVLAPDVERVVSLVRRPSAERSAKVAELVVPDLGDLSAVDGSLGGIDACFFCAGVSSAGMSEADYSRMTYDLTMSVARALRRESPGATFVFVSGQGTDATERGRVMWARVKGRTENALLGMGFRAAYMFRPGVIVPLHGIRSRTRLYRVAYAALGPALPIMRRLFPKQVTTTEQLGRAMLAVARHGYPRPILENADFDAA